MRTKNKKAAMEMSVGTMVTIVLLVIVLVLGIFFIQKIFATGTNAIDSIDNQVQSEIQKLFAREGGRIAVYPTSMKVVLKKGEDPSGFAFSVKNKGEAASFTFTIEALDVSNCGGSFTKEEANSYLIGKEGSFNIGRDASLDLPELVLLDIPETAPACTVSYRIDVLRNGEQYTGATVFVTIK